MACPEEEHQSALEQEVQESFNSLTSFPEHLQSPNRLTLSRQTSSFNPSLRLLKSHGIPRQTLLLPIANLPWSFTEKLVAKPDRLIKRHGKAGLLSLNKCWEESNKWITDKGGKPVKVI
jgi:hypothetical protein